MDDPASEHENRRKNIVSGIIHRIRCLTVAQVLDVTSYCDSLEQLHLNPEERDTVVSALLAVGHRSQNEITAMSAYAGAARFWSLDRKRPGKSSK